MKGHNFRARVLVLGLFFPLIALAGDITIFVKEKGEGSPVEGATVVLDQGDIYEQTDVDGRVHFADIPTPEKIKVLAPGYEALIRSLAPTSRDVTLYLIPVTVEGEGLEVVAARISEKASKISLSKDELLSTPGTQGPC